MQDVVAAEIDRHVSDPLHARVVQAGRIGEVDAVPAGQLAAGHEFALLHLRAGGRLQQDVRPFVEYVLHQGGTVEFRLRESFQPVAVPVVQAHRAVDVGDADLFISLRNHLFDLFVFALGQGEGDGVIPVYVHFLIFVPGLIPVSFLSAHGVCRALFGEAHGRVSRSRSRPDVYALSRHRYVLRLLFLGILGLRFRFGLRLGGDVFAAVASAAIVSRSSARRFGQRFSAVVPAVLFASASFAVARGLGQGLFRRRSLAVVRVSRSARAARGEEKGEGKGEHGRCHKMFFHVMYLR